MTRALQQELGDEVRINPLVITDAGTLKPIAYEFNPQFNVASIEELSSDVLRQYKQHELAPFQHLIGGAVGLQNAQDSSTGSPPARA